MKKQTQVTAAGIFFLCLIALNIGMEFIPFKNLPVVMRILIPQLGLFIPAAIYLAITKQNPFKLIRFRKVHPVSLLLVFPLVSCLQPLTIVVNALSMMVFRNHINNVVTTITTMIPFVFGVLLLAVTPGVVEEFTFRGVMLHSYHRDSNPWPAIFFSAACFGLMHMNFNQIMYATVFGIVLGILLEASGSIYSTMLAHAVFNASSVVMMYAMQWMVKLIHEHREYFGNMFSPSELVELERAFETSSEAVTPQTMLVAVLIFIIPAIFGTALAALLIYAIAALNKRQMILRGMFTKKTPEQKEAIRADKIKIWSPWLIAGMVLCVGFAVYIEIRTKLALG